MSRSREIEQELAYADDERLAVFYERHLVGDCEYRAPWIVAEVVERCAERGQRWLDLGAGTGLVGKALDERGVKLDLVAVDSSAAMLALAPAALYAARVRGDCRERLPFDDATFDGAVACGLFEHIEASDPVFRELARLLAPGAHLVFTFPPAAVPGPASALLSHDARRLRRDLEGSGFEWQNDRDIRAYRRGDQGWVTYRLVGARRDDAATRRPRSASDSATPWPMVSQEMQPQVRAYGSWASPITADLISRGGVGFGQLWFDGRRLFFSEIRPTEKGRSVIVRRGDGGELGDVTPPGFNARTRVHEYGGGDYVVVDDTVYFSNFADQRVYRQKLGASPEPVTAAAPLRFADYRFDAPRNRLICVREDKRRRASPEDVNTLVALDPRGDEEGGRILVEGNEFYASPRISPDGTSLCWLTWNHPDMPWDAAELWVAEFASDGSVGDRTRVAGGPGESVFQPEWAPDGTLHFLSDRTGFWNLYRRRGAVVEPLAARAAEFGVPQWLFGLATYAFVAPQIILCTYVEASRWRLARLDTGTQKLAAIETPYTWFSGMRGAPGSAVFLAGSPTEPPAIVRFDLASGKLEVLRRSTELAFDPGDISIPEAVEFPTSGASTAHAFYYRPKNRRFRAPAGEKPPLLVKVHGGPTGAATSLFALPIQYWTSRGFAVIDVNYGGSVGYGRAYRERLNGLWGIVDVDDCASAARWLVARGEVDPARLAISGGSAGGFTVLAALTMCDVFQTGASHYGISDLERLAEDGRAGNHKFESRYEDRLIAPYPSRADVYRARSPIHHVDGLSRPVIFFQGQDDRVVLPNQAEGMVDVLRQKGLPVAYLAFEGEGHGFRRAETIKRVLEAELYFYSRIFRFDVADPVDAISIDNLS